MQYWAEMRTALALARLGTVKAAAQQLGVHRATVNRHVDVLETAFNSPLFQRHARGYTLTDTGHELLDVAGRADEMFIDLLGRSRGRAAQLSGELIVTSLAGVAPLVMPVVKAFVQAHPGVRIRYVASEELLRLEYGESHVAIRAGPRPQMPDYVVRPFKSIRFGLYASQTYLQARAAVDPDDLIDQDFIGSLDRSSSLPYMEWMREHVDRSRLVLETRDQQVINCAVDGGLGIGFVAEHDAATLSGLSAVIAPDDRWSVALWLVTHRDLRRTAKVQALLTAARAWQA